MDAAQAAERRPPQEPRRRTESAFRTSVVRDRMRAEGANSADWDLVELLGMCARPGSTANAAAAGERVLAAQFDRVAYSFHGVYPAPFEHPALRQGLRVYDLVHRLAELSHRPDLRSIAALELGTSYEHLLPR